MKTRVRTVLWAIVLLCLGPHIASGAGLADTLACLTAKIPPRPLAAMTGSVFAKYVSGMDRPQREEAIVAELLGGNVPDFLRRLKPVQLIRTVGNGQPVRATVFTMPDYLAVGSEDDYLLIPMNLHSAITVARAFGFILPTPRIVDAVFDQSDIHFIPQPLPAGPAMRSTEYYVKHNQKISEQRRLLGVQPEALVSGHKKDVVIADRMARTRERIAIYGWHRPSGIPIQPLSTAHNTDYADYSHGIRLVSETVLVGSEPRSIYGVLQDPRLRGLLSDEGVVRALSRFFPVRHAGAGGTAAIGRGPGEVSLR
jgi:hypothetical protein